MAGPWEKYGQSTKATKPAAPWQKYKTQAPQPETASAPDIPETAPAPQIPQEETAPSSRAMRGAQRQTSAGMSLPDLMTPQPQAPAPAAPPAPAPASPSQAVPNGGQSILDAMEGKGMGWDRYQRATNPQRGPASQPQGADPAQGLGDLGKRAARGLTEVGAALPEAAAVAGAGNPNAAALVASETVQRAQEQIALAEQRMAEQPNMPAQQRARIAGVIEESRRTIEAYQPLADAAEGPLKPDADERPLYQRGEQVRQASQDLFGTPDPQFDDRFMSKLAEGGGNLAGFIGVTLLTGPLGGAAAGSGLNTSGMYRRAKQEGATEEQARSAAYVGSIVGASEVLPIGRAFRMLPSGLRGKATGALAKRLENAFVTAGEEGVQEAVVEIANNLTAKGIYNPEQQVLTGDVAEAALIGAILGGGMGAVAPSGGEEGPPRPDRQETPTQPTRAPAAPGRGPEPQAAPAASQPDPQTRTPRPPNVGVPPLDSASANARQPEREPAARPPQPNAGRPAAPRDPERYDYLPEIDTSSGEVVETGRTIRVDRETGEAQVEPEETQESAPATDGADQGGAVEPVVGSGSRPAPSEESTAPEPGPESAPQGKPERRFLTDEEMQQVETDASTFQYKDGGDEAGVTDRLQGVTKFDPNRAGQAVLYRTRDGRLIVADGHQRTGLAKRAKAAGQQDVGGMAAVIYDEADGYSPEDVMVAAAMKNIGEGSGTPLDAARILRDRPESVEDLGLPPKSALVRDAQGLRQLSDDAFGMVANGAATDRDGAIVGRVVENRDLHADVLNLLGKLKPQNATQAEMIARDAAADSQTETQSSLFGDEQVSQSLYLERAKILDGAMKGIRQDRATFNTLVKRGDAITGAGNQLNQDANQRRAVEDGAALQYLSTQANMKGPISDALSRAATAYKSGDSTLGQARKAFVEDVRRSLQGDDPAGAPDGARGGAAGQLAPEGRQAETPDVSPDPQTETTPEGEQSLIPGVAPVTDRDRAEAQMNRPMQGGNAGPGSGRDDLFGNESDRADLFDAPAEPTETDDERRAKAFEARIAPYARTAESRRAFGGSTNIFDKVGAKLLADLEAAPTVAARRKVADDFVRAQGDKRGVENMVVLDADGQLISVTSGHASGVSMPDYAFDMAADGKVAYATHNHPRNSGFSPSDMAFLSLVSDEVAAIGQGGALSRGAMTDAYRARIEGEAPTFERFDKLKTAFDTVGRIVQGHMQGMVDRGELSIDAAPLVHSHMMNLVLDRHGLVDFVGNSAEIVNGEGVDADGIFAATDAKNRAALGRAGFDVPALRDRRGDQDVGRDGDGAGRTAPERPEAAGLPAQDQEGGDGSRRVPPAEVEPDAFDGAADEMFGAETAAAPETDAFDAAADDLFGSEPPPKKRAPAKRKTPSKADDAASLNALFGKPGLREDAPAFDDAKYREAVPIFARNVEGFDLNDMSDKDAYIAMARPLVDAGMTREAYYGMRPYFERFLGDVRAGRIDLDGETDAPAPRGDLEPDSGDADAQDAVGGDDVSDAAGADGQGDRARGDGAGRGDGRGQDGGRVPQGDAAPVGSGGRAGVRGDGRSDGGRSDTDGDGTGSRDRGEPGLRPDDGPADATGREAADSTDRVTADPKAQPSDHHAEVARAVPALRPEQVDDVVRIERRFFRPEEGKQTGFGILITNGTGTGKTMTAQGAVKRFLDDGAESILAVVKTQGEVENWLDHAALSGIDSMAALRDTNDNGAGRAKVVVTTYANLANNPSLADREWDLVTADETHMLGSNKTGDQTEALKAFRAITNKPSHVFEKEMMLRREALEKARAIKDEDKSREEVSRIFDEAREAARKEMEKPRRKRSRAVFLSATPWAYDLNTDYGEGYLFDYPKDETREGSRQSGRNWFMVENFGYRIRYHKLNKPEAAVDQGVFHREFHERLKREGALWGRKLSVDTDYDRKFVEVENDLGGKIDRALDYLNQQEREARDALQTKIKDDTSSGDALDSAQEKVKAWEDLNKAVRRKFGYLQRMQLLEAMKAEAAIPDIQAHLDMGRKVVVFHDFNTGGGSSPFKGLEGLDEGSRAALSQMRADLPWLADLDFERLDAPKTAMLKAFGDRAVEYNGTVSKKAREAAKKKFNADGSGVDVIVVQSDAGSGGISLHDTTGGHMRALVNLGMPTKPTTSLQAEGRTRRVGSVSNSPYRYYTIGTTWEREAFANRIAAQSGAVENLAMGNEARAIRESFIDAYENAGRNLPSETDGVGGLEADLRDNATSDFDRAKSHYFGRQKMKGKRDQRAGIDFFPTPEPLGLKMVEWAGIRPYDKVLEPSAGDGSISRYFPQDSDRTIVEPSDELGSRAALRTPGARVVSSTFEDLNITNKYDVTVMNPPFGRGGKTAMEHLAKAFQHTRDGGRIVALIPTGPAADKRFDAWIEANAQEKKAARAFVSATYALPASTFERAGTAVAARVVVIDRVPNKDAGTRIYDWMEANGQPRDRKISGANIAKFFENIESMGGPARFEQIGPSGVEADMDAADAAQASQTPQVQPPMIEGDAADLFDTFAFGNSKTGVRQYGVQIKPKLGDRFADVRALAKVEGGYYSRYRNKSAGAKAGFLFPDKESRARFMEGLQTQRQDYGLAEPGLTFGQRPDNPGAKTNAEKPYAIWSKREKRIVAYAATKKGGRRAVDNRDMQVGGYQHRLIDNPAYVGTKEQRPRAGQTLMGPDARDAVLPQLRAELDRLNLKRVRLGLDAPGQTRQGALTIDQLGQVDILIGQSLNPLATMYHEVVHAMRGMNLFTAEEWAALEAEGKRWVGKHDIARRYPDLSPSEMIEEAIAEEFAERVTNRQPPRQSLLIRAFDKMHRLLKGLRNAVRGAGFRTAEDVFGEVMAGRIGQRNAETAAMAKVMEQAAQPLPRITRAPAAQPGNRPLPVHVPDRHLWEELTRSGAGVFERLTGARGALMDKVDRARLVIQDRFLPVLRAQQAIERAIGKPLGDEHNAYVTETTFSGKVGRHFFEIDEQFTKPIIDLIAKTDGGLTADNVGDWLAARHAKERNAQIAKINPAMPDGGSGITDAQADAYLAQMAASPYRAELDQIADLIDGLRERTLKLRRDAGLLSQQEYLTWKNQYDHYVPLKGFAESDHAEAALDVSGIGRRYNIKGAESRVAMGRRSMAFNPLVAALAQAKETALRAEKNRVGQAAYRLARDHGSESIWTVKTPQQKRYFNRTTGLVETRTDPATAGQQAPNEFAVKVDGQEKRIVIHDERIIPALSSMGTDRLDTLTQIVGFYTRFQSMVNTMLSPEFVLRNAFRDFTAAQINLPEMAGEDRKGFGKAVAKSWRGALVGAFRGMGGKEGTEWTDWYKEFDEAGAKISFWTLDNPEAGMDDLHRRIRLARGPKAARILKAATSPRAIFSTRDNAILGFIERANLAVDNAVRLAAYAEARKRGWSKPKAAALAKNLTVNFNRRGTSGSLINSWFMFANAAIQSLQVFMSVMTSKRGAMIGAGGVMLGFALDMVNAYLSEEDDDGKLAYDKIPEYRSQRTLLLQAAGRGEDGFNNAYGAPLPYTYSLFPYAGTQIGKVARGAKKPGEALGDFLVAVLSDVSPTGFGSLEQTLFPTLLKDINEFADNEDWLDRNIRPENPWGDYGPMAYKYYGGVSEASKQVTDFLNRATGGNAAESGLIDVSPEYLDHFAGKLTGGAGRFWGETSDALAKALTGQGELIETRQIPWAADVYVETGKWYDRSAFYENVDTINDAHKRVRLAAEAGETPPKRYAALDTLYTDANRARRDVGEMNDQIQAVRANKALSAQEKVKRVEAIEQRAQRLYDAVNRRFYTMQARLDARDR